jgi:drug/metabolite transporter (DMT)-like permease
MILFHTSPFWAGILGFFINKERIEKFEYLAMAICFGGVLIITFGKPKDPESTTDAGDSTRYYGIAFAFFIAWLFAACNVINRYLKAIHPATVIFFHALCGLTLAITYMVIERLVTGNPFRTYTA